MSNNEVNTTREKKHGGLLGVGSIFSACDWVAASSQRDGDGQCARSHPQAAFEAATLPVCYFDIRYSLLDIHCSKEHEWLSE